MNSSLYQLPKSLFTRNSGKTNVLINTKWKEKFPPYVNCAFAAGFGRKILTHCVHIRTFIYINKGKCPTFNYKFTLCPAVTLLSNLLRKTNTWLCLPTMSNVHSYKRKSYNLIPIFSFSLSVYQKRVCECLCENMV